MRIWCSGKCSWSHLQSVAIQWMCGCLQITPFKNWGRGQKKKNKKQGRCFASWLHWSDAIWKETCTMSGGCIHRVRLAEWRLTWEKQQLSNMQNTWCNAWTPIKSLVATTSLPKLSFGNHWKFSFYLIMAQEFLTNTFWGIFTFFYV